MPGYSQENRLVSLTTPLGEDKLLLAGFSGHEAVSRLFSFHLDLLQDKKSEEYGAIDFTTIIGQAVTIAVVQSDDNPRYFNGIVSRFAQSGEDNRFVHYQMEMVPWTWKMTRYADCHIFHNKSVTDIIKAVFDARGFTDYQVSTTASYPALEYCVQYRETDFNFISRLMEQNGIFYFFKHEKSKHTMVIADSSSIYQDCPGHPKAGYDLAATGVDADDVVTAWSIEQSMQTGMYTHTDYNFETPSASLTVSESTIYPAGDNAAFEVFDFPGDYTIRGDGTTLAKLRMQEIEAGHLVAHGTSVCRAFATGYTFTLEDHPQSDQNQSYLLTEVQHVASVAGNYTAGDESAGHYSNRFTCVPVSVDYRPARLTPKPFVQGPQTAVVVNKTADDSSGSGEEIWVDKYGRVIVEFPWDRKGDCSCWVRVSQEWAGQGYGAMAIPRVGQEVLVSFLEGDPDRPIITGRVYNAQQTVPYALPANQTRSTFMTRSSKGGDTTTYNELRFEDLKGKEQVFLRAQFDQDNRVLHDSREWVGNNRSLMVTKDQMESVGGDLHVDITGKFNEKIGGDTNTQITGNWNEKIGQNLSTQVGMNLYEKSGQTWAHEAGQTIHLKSGMTVVIEAGVELCLKVGGNFIDINPAGVSIVGTMVMINSGGSAGSGPGSSPTSPGDPTKPDQADDGSTGTKYGSGSTSSSSSSGSSGGAGGASAPSSPPSSPSVPSAAGAVAAAAGAAQGAAGELSQAAQQAGQAAEQAVQQATQQATQAAQAAANEAQQVAQQAAQAAQQVEQQAQQAVAQVTQEARQAFNQANQAVQQAQQAVNDATAQGKAAAQQALAQAQQMATQAAQQAAQAVQQAKAAAAQAEQQAKAAAAQAQQAAAQAQQQAQQAAAQAQQAAKQAEQQAQQAVQQGKQTAQQAEQQAQQAANQAKQAAQQAQQQAQQAANQAKQAASQAQQQAQQAGQQVQQAAKGATQQAQQAAQGAQQAASQAVSQAARGF